MFADNLYMLISFCVGLVSLITPIVRLNGAVVKLNTTLDGLVARIAHAEEQLDLQNSRISNAERETAVLKQNVKSVHKRIDEHKQTK